MRKLNQKGFGFMYWLLLLLILILLGWLGWYLYKKPAKKLQNTQPSTIQQQTKQSDTSKTETAYLVIKEWGVRVALKPDVKEAYYIIKAEAPNYAYLSLTPLKTSTCAADKTTLGVYTRINNLNDVNNDSAGADGKTYAQMGYGTSPHVGSKYYYYSQPQSFCSSNHTQDKAYWDEFKNILPTIETAIQ